MDGIEMFECLPGLPMAVRADLVAEMREQALWPREVVPAWRRALGDPRNETPGGEAGGESEAGGEGAGAAGEGAGAGGEAGGEGVGGEAGAQTQTAPDFESLFSDFSDRFESRFEGIEEALNPPPPEPVKERTDFFDLRNFSDEDFDADGELKPEAQQRALQSMIDQRVAEALSPMQRARAEERRVAEADALEAKYPDLADPAKREPILGTAREFANFMAERTGDPSRADMWTEPVFIELVMLAQIGKQAAGGQQAAGQQKDVTLERGGSAGPGGDGGGGTSNERAQSIVKLAQSSKYRLGS